MSIPNPSNERLRYRTDTDCNLLIDEWALGSGSNYPPGGLFWYIHSIAYVTNTNGSIKIGKQIAYGYSVDKVIYERTCSSGVWNEWTQLPTRSEVDALNSNGLYDRGGLINNVDLNTYKTPGLYYCSSTGGSNFPTGMSYSAVLVEVSLFANGGGVCQVCIDAVGLSKRIWRRYFVNNAWSAWVKQPERDEIETLNSKTKKNVTNLISGLEVSANGCYLFGTGLKQISLQLRSTGAISQDATIFSVPSEMAPADITYTPIFIFDTNSIDTIYPAIMSGVEVRIKKAIPSGKYLSVQILYY